MDNLMFSDPYSKTLGIAFVICFILKGILCIIYFKKEAKFNSFSPNVILGDVANEKKKPKLFVNALVFLQYLIGFALLVINWNKV